MVYLDGLSNPARRVNALAFLPCRPAFRLGFRRLIAQIQSAKHGLPNLQVPKSRLAASRLCDRIDRAWQERMSQWLDTTRLSRVRKLSGISFRVVASRAILELAKVSKGPNSKCFSPEVSIWGRHSKNGAPEMRGLKEKGGKKVGLEREAGPDAV